MNPLLAPSGGIASIHWKVPTAASPSHDTVPPPVPNMTQSDHTIPQSRSSAYKYPTLSLEERGPYLWLATRGRLSTLRLKRVLTSPTLQQQQPCLLSYSSPASTFLPLQSGIDVIHLQISVLVDIISNSNHTTHNCGAMILALAHPYLYLRLTHGYQEGSAS